METAAGVLRRAFSHHFLLDRFTGIEWLYRRVSYFARRVRGCAPLDRGGRHRCNSRRHLHALGVPARHPGAVNQPREREAGRSRPAGTNYSGPDRVIGRFYGRLSATVFAANAARHRRDSAAHRQWYRRARARKPAAADKIAKREPWTLTSH